MAGKGKDIRKKTPTLEEYQDMRAAQVRDSAAASILGQHYPNVPRVPSEDFLSKLAGVLGASDETRFNLFGANPDPATCIYTATDKYGDKKVSGNVTFRDNPEKYGFVGIPMEDSKIGDLIQFNTNDWLSGDMPHHATIYTGNSDSGDILLSYSRGGTGEYTDTDEGKKPTMAKNMSIGYVSEQLGFPTAYRYVGTPQKREEWAREYSKKYNVEYNLFRNLKMSEHSEKTDAIVLPVTKPVPKEERHDIKKAFEDKVAFDKMMRENSVQNTATPQYKPVFQFSNGGYLQPKNAWDALSMREKAAMIKVAVQNGIFNLQEIRDKYNEFAEGGDKGEVVVDNTNSQYINTMEKVADENYKKWGYSNPDEALLHALNDNIYNYRGYYGKYPQSKANADTHWTDDFKTVYHPTFSNESIYSGQKSQYNPLGLPGGFWSGDTFVPMAWQIDANEYKHGGSIYIKPSHRGRLTELKKRTGKTEAELYRTGSPAVRKMITFARNSRKWHADGGPLVNLFDGESQPTQQMQIGLNVQGWPNYTTEQIVAYGDENERRRKAIQDAYLNFVTESNDATAVANGRLQNQHLVDRAIEGAKAHRAWEEEHPATTFAGNVLGAAPLAIAAIPAIGAAVESAPAVASALAPGSTFWMNPITKQVTASTLGGTTVDAISKRITGNTIGENVRSTIGYQPTNEWARMGYNFLTDMTNPGYFTPYGLVESGTARTIEGISPINRAVKNTVDNIERRGAETFMRTTPLANPIPEARRGLVGMWNGEIGGRQRLAHIANYVLTGRKIGPKGYYNSFADYQPMNLANIVKEPTWAERWDAFMHPVGTSKAYSGFVDVNGKVPAMTERDDIIDAFLYGKDIDPTFGVKRVSIGENFGPHTDYVRTNYPSKARDIPVYEMNTPDGVDIATPEGNWQGVENGLFDGGNGDFLNVAGHIGTRGRTPDGGSVIQRQDIWKFNPDDYFTRWLQNKRPYEDQSPLLKKATMWGLNEVDRLGTPIITRTKWDKWGWL